MTERPLPPDADAPETVEWAGKFVLAKRRGRWEYAGRARGIRAAVILAVDAGEVILVEQYRVPLGKFCLELPAGLIGDETEGEDDARQRRAASSRRRPATSAAHWEDLGEFYSSPGMVQESFTLLKATGLTRVGDGGGTEHEDIVVHRVPLDRDRRDDRRAPRARATRSTCKLLMLLGAQMLEDAAQ